jgi:hypothetical protein
MSSFTDEDKKVHDGDTCRIKNNLDNNERSLEMNDAVNVRYGVLA